MQKIGDSTSTANDAGEFSEGNPGAGVDPTWLTAAWHNSVQRELVEIVEAGGLALDPAIDDQVLSALQILVRRSSSAYALDSGAANVYVASFTPPITAITDGMVLRVKAKTANTGASTFSPDGLAAKAIVGLAQVPLQGGEVVAAGTCTVVYSLALDKWVLISCSGGDLQIAPGSQSQHAVNVSQIQAGYGTYGLDTGTATDYAVAYAPVIPSLTDGMTLHFMAKTTNTGSATFSPNGLAARPILNAGGTALVAGNIAANGMCEVQYSSTAAAWILQASSASNFSSGRLINTKIITSSGTYTKTVGTKKIRVRQCGGGGAGASVPASGSGFCAVGSGGASGSEAEAVFSSGFDSVAVTIGAGGVPSAGTAGGGGGITSFGALLISPGGGGGNVIQASTSSPFVSGQGIPGSNSTSSGADSIFVKTGQPGASGISLGAVSLSGQGAPSNFGSGGLNSGSGAGTAATGYGAGGGGAANQSSGAAYLGGTGSQGFVIVEEWS